MIRKFIVENLSDQTFQLGIEPWADSEVLHPRSQVVFEYQECGEPTVIEFSIGSDGHPSVGIVSDFIKITGSNGEKVFGSLPPK